MASRGVDPNEWAAKRKVSTCSIIFKYHIFIVHITNI